VKLKQRTTCIFGLRGSGKTTFGEYLADNSAFKCIIYDTVREYPIHKRFDVCRPIDPYSIDELVRFINFHIKRVGDTEGKRIKYNLLVIDEANRFLPGGGHPLHPALVDLNDQLRHPPYEIGVVYIARRPTQIHPDVIGLADSVLCFLLTGKNDIVYLNDLKMGFGDQVSELKPFHSILFSNGQLTHINPIMIKGKK